MSFSRRLRTIALSQIQAIQERLNRIDAEAAEEAEQKRYRQDARNEINDPTDIRLPMRSPEEIAAGTPRASGSRPPSAPAASYQRPQPTTQPPTRPEPSAAPVQAPQASALSLHYKVLGLDDGTDFSTVQSTYNKLAARCDATRFPEGSEDRKMAEAIRTRVDSAYDALRDALDATAGRFDKLEFE